jgi:hypothetical protein
MQGAQLLGAAQLAPRASGAHHGRRRPRARAARAGKGYFSEADPNVGLTPLWGQQPKRDLVTQARARCALCRAPRLRLRAGCVSPRALCRRLCRALNTLLRAAAVAAAATQKEEGELLWCAARVLRQRRRAASSPPAPRLTGPFPLRVRVCCRGAAGTWTGRASWTRRRAKRRLPKQRRLLAPAVRAARAPLPRAAS